MIPIGFSRHSCRGENQTTSQPNPTRFLVSGATPARRPPVFHNTTNTVALRCILKILSLEMVSIPCPFHRPKRHCQKSESKRSHDPNTSRCLFMILGSRNCSYVLKSGNLGRLLEMPEAFSGLWWRCRKPALRLGNGQYHLWVEGVDECHVVVATFG